MLPKRILVPVDGSKCSEAAVDHAAVLAELFDAPITLLHAWEPLYELGVVMGAATIATADGTIPLVQHIADEARKVLERHAERLSSCKATVHKKLAEGPTRQVIRDVLDCGEHDMVVMGTHGRTGLSHLMMGSLAEWVVRHAPVPVMTIRAEAPAGEQP